MLYRRILNLIPKSTKYNHIHINYFHCLSKQSNYAKSSPIQQQHYKITHQLSNNNYSFNKIRHYNINRIGGHYYNAFRPGENIIYGIIASNTAIFMMWRYFNPNFMYRHFTCSIDNLYDYRFHTLLTSAFSHIDIYHLGANMIGLYFFGRSILSLFGPEKFLNLYLSGAIGGSTADCLYKYIKEKNDNRNLNFWYNRYNRSSHTLGASGAVNAVMTLFICYFPKEIIYLNLFIPVPAFLLGVLFLAHEFSGLHQSDNISHAAHLGGIGVGVLFFLKSRFFRY